MLLFDYYISMDVGVIFQIFHPSSEESLADPVKGTQKRASGIKLRGLSKGKSTNSVKLCIII